MAQFHVIIPAAGSGSRMGSAQPKQYLSLNGCPMILRTLQVFFNSPRIHSVTVVISPDDAYWETIAPIHPKLRVYACGGDTRAATVLNGLQAMQVDDDDWILVHDAARPGLSQLLLNQLLDNLESDEVGGLLAIPLADTLKRADDQQRVAKTEPRENLWQAQTPQMFRYQLLLNALQANNGAPTDEAQAVEALGYSPKLVAGELRNFKVTYPQDVQLAEAILAADDIKQENSLC